VTMSSRFRSEPMLSDLLDSGPSSPNSEHYARMLQGIGSIVGHAVWTADVGYGVELELLFLP